MQRVFAVAKGGGFAEKRGEVEKFALRAEREELRSDKRATRGIRGERRVSPPPSGAGNFAGNIVVGDELGGNSSEGYLRPRMRVVHNKQEPLSAAPTR